MVKCKLRDVIHSFTSPLHILSLPEVHILARYLKVPKSGPYLKQLCQSPPPTMAGLFIDIRNADLSFMGIYLKNLENRGVISEKPISHHGKAHYTSTV